MRAIILGFMRWVDLAVIALYLIAITWFGSRFKKSQKTLKDYFQGGRTAPWWAIAFSIVSGGNQHPYSDRDAGALFSR